MDIGDIIKDYFWVIIAVLFYLFAGRKKAKKEQREQVAKGETQSRSTPASRPAASGLQERLEQALREMQSQGEKGRAPVAAQPVPASVSAPQATSVISSDIGHSLEYGAAESAYDFHTTVPLHERKTALDIALENAAAAGQPSATEFTEGHGLRYHSHSAEMGSSKTPEFKQAHGMHYGEAPSRSSKKHSTPVLQESSPALFSSDEELRRAVVTAEILGPPKGRQAA